MAGAAATVAPALVRTVSQLVRGAARSMGSVAAMTALEQIGPAFVAMAHRIVWCTVATVDAAGRPRTRVLHPLWAWDGARLIGWILTSPRSPKRRHLDANPVVSLTYWAPDHDTCSADCATAWELSPEQRRQGWDRFEQAPAPVGYDPRIIPQWTSPEVEDFGVLRLEPQRLRVMPGSLMLRGTGELLQWRAPSA